MATTEVVTRDDLPRGEIARFGDDESAVGNRERKAVLDGAHAKTRRGGFEPRGVEGHRHGDQSSSKNAAVVPPSASAGSASLRWSHERVRVTSMRTATRLCTITSTIGRISSV
jgi:hypothetical protein